MRITTFGKIQHPGGRRAEFLYIAYKPYLRNGLTYQVDQYVIQREFTRGRSSADLVDTDSQCYETHFEAKLHKIHYSFEVENRNSVKCVHMPSLKCKMNAQLVRGSRDTMRRHSSVLHRYTCKVVFRQLLSVDSFSVLSIHCVARGLVASFLYKCPASCGGSLRHGSLRQHGLPVAATII